MSERKSVQLNAETHRRLKEMAGEAGLTIDALITSLLNMVENRANYAKEFEGVAKVPKSFNPLVTDEERSEKPNSDYEIYVAIFLRDMGIISQEQFDSFKGEDLGHLVTIRSAEFVERFDVSKLGKQE